MKFARRRLSRDPTATTTRTTRRSTCSARTPSSSGTRTPTSRAPTSSSCPAASRTATTCAPARSRASRRSWRAVAAFAARGGPVLGICNGFQMLLEAGLLPGAMLRNRDLKFHCEHVHVRVEQTDTPFTLRGRAGAGAADADRARRRQLLRRPPDVLRRSRRIAQVDLPLLRRRRARSTDAANPNGSVAQHRRHLQRGAQRRRPDAASRARLRGGARQRRRPA